MILVKKASKLLSSDYRMKFSTIALILLLTISASDIIFPAASADVTAVPDRPTGTFVGVSPTLLGVGQEMVINIITYPAPQGPTFWVSDLVGVFPSGFQNITCTITKPDGTQSTFMPIDETLEHIGVKVPGAAQIVGSLQFRYKPDQVGNYSISASFPGQTYTNQNVSKTLNQTVYYNPSSSETTKFSVQQEPVLGGLLNGYPWSPLPNEYWSNPVFQDNREWAAISGDWVTSGYDLTGTKYNSYSTAPSSPHILWANIIGSAALPGGVWGSLTYNDAGGGAAGIILDGKIYQASSMQSGYFDCIDLRTGQTLWTALGNPSRAQRLNLDYQTIAQVNEGGIDEFLWQFNTGYWLRYNPYNGAVVQNITGVPTDIAAPAFEDGNPVTYMVQRGGFNTTRPMNFAYEYLLKWDFQKLNINQGLNNVLSNNWKDGLVWNVSVRQPNGADPGISAVGGNAAISVNWWPNVNVVTVRGANTYMGFDMSTGAYLWNGTTVVSMNGGGSGGPTGPESFGPQLIFDGSDSSWVAYDMRTGKEMWSTRCESSPWSDLPSFLYVFHNGNVYVGSYDGHVYALDLKDGHIVWKSDYVGAEDESIYGNQPFNGASVGADGTLYFSTSTTYRLVPRTRFHELVAINETTGHFMWTLPIDIDPKAIADGYLVGTDKEDGIQYCIGKGQTATTVTTQQLQKGMLIQGTVMDMSPGKPNTAAIRDTDMSTWMDYLYGQNATLLNSPPNVQGVPVMLTAVDSNGNSVDLGTVTSDSSGHFGFNWDSSTAGMYTIYATFAGSNSYYSSYAEASGVVASTPVASPTTESTSIATNADLANYLIIGIVAIIITIAIVGALLLRKKQ